MQYFFSMAAVHGDGEQQSQSLLPVVDKASTGYHEALHFLSSWSC